MQESNESTKYNVRVRLVIVEKFIILVLILTPSEIQYKVTFIIKTRMKFFYFHHTTISLPVFSFSLIFLFDFSFLDRQRYEVYTYIWDVISYHIILYIISLWMEKNRLCHFHHDMSSNIAGGITSATSTLYFPWRKLKHQQLKHWLDVLVGCVMMACVWITK